MTRDRARDTSGGPRCSGRDSGYKSQTSARAAGAGPTFPTPSISRTIQSVPSSRGPLLPALLRRIQHLVPPEISPEPEPEYEQESELEPEPLPEVAEDEGDFVPGDQIEITVMGDVLLPSEKCSRAIRKIFEKKLHIKGAKWKTVPQEMKEYYFQEFKKHFSWDESIDHQVRNAWNKKAGKRYSDLMSEMRNKGVRPSYVPEAFWKKWLEVWSDPAYVRMLHQNALNRRKGDERGVAPACHTGGSLNHLEHRKRLAAVPKSSGNIWQAEQLGRDPTPHELFIYTHTKQHDGKTFVVEKAKEVNERVASIKEQMAQNSSTVDESQIFFEAAGGKVKSKVYGLGSVGQDYYKHHKSNPSTYISENKSAELQQQIKELQKLRQSTITSKNESQVLQQQLKELQKMQQSTEERHEERYNLLLETIKKQTEIISAMQQKIESTAQIDGPPAKKNPRSNLNTRVRK